MCKVIPWDNYNCKIKRQSITFSYYKPVKFWNIHLLTSNPNNKGTLADC